MKPHEYTKEIKYNNISFRSGRMLAHTPHAPERHSFYEILYFIEGIETTLITENFQKKTAPGTMVIIPKETYHFFRYELPEKSHYDRLIMTFPDIPEFKLFFDLIFNEIKVLQDINAHITHILNQMRKILEHGNYIQAAKIALYGYFQCLISELTMSNIDTESQTILDHDPLITECIRYINENFTSKFTIESMATSLSLSPSTLFHEFKKAMGISIHQFVTEKRLVYAQKLLSEKNMATKIYADCGFNDYSSFYKAYKKMFGRPPSSDKS